MPPRRELPDPSLTVSVRVRRSRSTGVKRHGRRRTGTVTCECSSSRPAAGSDDEQRDPLAKRDRNRIAIRAEPAQGHCQALGGKVGGTNWLVDIDKTDEGI